MSYAEDVSETGVPETINITVLNDITTNGVAIDAQTTRTTVNQNQNRQYQTTILKTLGDALDLKGNHIEWKVLSGSALEV